MIINLTHLNSTQFEALTRLEKVCLKEDGDLPALYPHLITQPRVLPTHLLYYQQSQLVGFLGVYFFYDNACEISLLIHPKWRGLGFSQQLFSRIKPLITLHGLKEIIFTSPESFHDYWQSREDIQYHHSEFQMCRTSHRPPSLTHQKLTYRQADVCDKEGLERLDTLCFQSPPQEYQERLALILHSTEYTLIVGLMEETIIAKGHIRWLEDKTILSDIAVLPDYQGQGFGRELLSHCIYTAHQRHCFPLQLDVETNNKNALKLYSDHGFKITNACEYWSMKL